MATIKELLGITKTIGEIGIEIEIESLTPIVHDKIKNWSRKEDHSLRGFSAEYVTSSPVSFANVEQHLLTLKTALEENNIIIEDSFRAGIHIHTNILDFYPAQIGNFCALYYVLEDVLIKYCGFSREGNLFCLTLSSAEDPLNKLIDFLQSNNLNVLNRDNIRYAALNLSSIPRHGSLEFRALKTTKDWNKILNWVKIIQKLKEYSLTIPTPVEISYQISSIGPEHFAKQVLGDELYKEILIPNISSTIMRSLRNIQELIHWENL